MSGKYHDSYTGYTDIYIYIYTHMYVCFIHRETFSRPSCTVEMLGMHLNLMYNLARKNRPDLENVCAAKVVNVGTLYYTFIHVLLH